MLEVVIAAGAGPAPTQERRPSISLIRFQTFVILVGGLLLAAATPECGYAKTLAAWVQLVGPGRDASIRVIVPSDSSCPILAADGEPLAMQVRAEPGPIFSEGKLPPRADFPVRICEVTVPEGKKRVLLDDKPLPLPWRRHSAHRRLRRHRLSDKKAQKAARLR